MLFKIPFLTERMATKVASIWSHLFMNMLNVLVHYTEFRKPSVTMLTLKWFWTLMYIFHVLQNGWFSTALVSTNTALKWSGPYENKGYNILISTRKNRYSDSISRFLTFTVYNQFMRLEMLFARASVIAGRALNIHRALSSCMFNAFMAFNSRFQCCSISTYFTKIWFLLFMPILFWSNEKI